MATQKSVNKIAVDELRRSCDTLNHSVDQLRSKTLAFIAAAFAVLTYLYSGGNLFIPSELYGKVFYFIGLGALLSAVVIFLMGLRPYQWNLTTEIKALKNIPQKGEDEYLEYVKDQYVECYEKNSFVYENKHSSFNFGFILLVAGAFILIVIRTFPSSNRNCYTNESTACITVHAKGGTK